MINNLQEKIDNEITFFDKGSYSLSNKLNIVCGDYQKVLANLLVKKAYYGKVAVFSSQNNFLILGNEIKKSLRENKILTIDYTLSLKEEISIETFSKLFNLPDDIRAVIVLDGKVSKIADYFADIKKVPVFDISCGLDVGDYLENTFYLKNGQGFDVLEVNPNKTIIIDESLTEKLNVKQYCAFDYIMKNIVSILDIRINAFYKNEKLDAEIINLKSKAISETFSIMNVLEKEREEKLILNSIVVGLTNKILKKDYLLNDSVKNLSLLYYGFNFDSEKELLFAEKIINIYGIMVNRKSKIYTINDYNNISLEISKTLNIDEENIIDGIIDKFVFLKNSEKTFDDFIEKFNSEFSSISKSFKKVLMTQTVLNGKDLNKDIDNEKLIKAIKLSGALNNISGLALFINEGFANLIV